LNVNFSYWIDYQGHLCFNIDKQASDYDKNNAFRDLWLQ